MSKKTVIMLMGTPGAGKSTLGRRLAGRGWHHVELDSYLWALPEDVTEYDKVVIDCTNEGEMFWCQFMAPFYDYRRILIYVDTPVSKCKQRRTHIPVDYLNTFHDNCEHMWSTLRYEYFDHAWRILCS